MHPSNTIVQGLWIGPRLSTMERLSIKSFLANGHEFHLYTYADVEGIPEGTIVKDGNEIVPEKRVKDFRFLAQFSNLFSYKLLLDKGNYFSDLDNVCLKPLDFSDPYIFYRDRDQSTVTAALCKAPVGSPITKHLIDTINDMTPEQLSMAKYQELGPDLTRKALMQYQNAYGYRIGSRNTFSELSRYFKPGVTFDPIGFQRAGRLVDPTMVWDLSQSYSLHLFSGAWENMPEHGARADYKLLTSKDAIYPDGSLYEQLKRRFLD